MVLAKDPCGDLPGNWWKNRTLEEMSREEWESLCDGCGRCCLHKVRNVDDQRVHLTSVACRLLDTTSCRCTDYQQRHAMVPECLPLSPECLRQDRVYLPPTCAYRLVAQGRDLEWWHPLVSGRPGTVHEAGISVRGRVISQRDGVDPGDHLALWPGTWPLRALKKRSPSV